jgi:hypothetical protein
MITNIYKFFTIWTLLLTIFHKYTSKYFNLVFLSTIVLIIGSFISLIHPRFFVIYFLNNKYIISNTLIKFLTADLMHICLFVFNYYKYGYDTKNILNSLLLLLFYSLTINFIKLYNLDLYNN